MLGGFDVSRWQRPSKLDWNRMGEDPHFRFIVARATYGAKTADRRFVEFIKRSRDVGLVVSAYLFLRQVHSVQEQLALFDQQLDKIGGLHYGTDMFPVLDLETNEANGDGRIRARHFAEMAQTIAYSWIDQYGGCIIYCSSYFPSWLGAGKGPAKDYSGWLNHNPKLHLWLADYDRPPGKPRNPYTKWAIHQPKPQKHLYYNKGKTIIDYDVVNPSIDFDDLLTPPLEVGKGLSVEACQCECQTTERPGGAG